MKKMDREFTMKGRPGESGVALITVLALLSIFAVVLVGFTYSIRMEEYTLQNYADTVNVTEATEAAIQGVLGQLSKDLDPSKQHNVLGRPQPRYVSLMDPWAIGYSGQAGPNVLYDARSHQLDVRPSLRRQGLTAIPTPIPLGVDEDPPGDVTGQPAIGQTGRGDGYPGLRGVDDDLDGQVDVGAGANDDDEDFLADEDGYDRRRPDKRGAGFFAPGSGYDQDGDRLGVFDENAKININFAGNNFGSSGDFVYNLGIGPHELDLPVFIYNRVYDYRPLQGGRTTLSGGDAENLARRIVNLRYGSTADGGVSLKRPGADNQDDNNNNDPNIVQVLTLSDASRITSFKSEPFAIVGNNQDNDNDGLINEEDEIYIGATTVNRSGSSLNDAISSKTSGLLQFRPGDRRDNDGDGYIDEQNEGVDDPDEFNFFRPKADDRPYSTVEDLRLVNGMMGRPNPLNQNELPFPSLFEILSQSTTIYSQSDQVSGPLSGAKNEIGRINPNNSYNWRAIDMWDPNDRNAYRADFQYSPPIRIEDLLALQVDLDGDWQLHAEPDVERGMANGIDDDGDGLIDEPSDDYDGNLYPSGDFDGFGEPDVNSPSVRDGQDSDFDGFVVDDGRSASNAVGQLRRLPMSENDYRSRPRNETDRNILPGIVLEGNGQDDDGDNLVDDNGDFNGDGLLSYDPEWHVSEDAYGDLSLDGYPGLGADPDSRQNTALGDIINKPRTNHDLLVTNFADDDWDGYADFYDPQVLAAMYAPEMDGVDNDADGEVDEIGERYIAAFDDDEDGRMDEDPPQFQLALNLIDYIDAFAPYQPSDDPDVRDAVSKREDDPVLSDPVTERTFTLYTSRQRAFRMHSRLLAGPNAVNQSDDLFAEYMRMLLPNPPVVGMKTRFEGVEGIRINEVFAKPMIRLEAEEVLDAIEYDPADPNAPAIIRPSSRFRVTSGGNDDGLRFSAGGGSSFYDSNWGEMARQLAAGSASPNPQPGYAFLPEGFRNTYNPFLPIANLDTLSPAFIFSVTQAAPAIDPAILVGRAPETAVWTFENLPQGVYDVVLYLHPNHGYRPEVTYSFNNTTIPLISEAEGNRSLAGAVRERFIRNIGRFRSGGSYQTMNLENRLLPVNVPNQENPLDPASRVVIGSNGNLTVEISAADPITGEFYETSFDRIELINTGIQYVELVNITNQDIDLNGWSINTPYGHYVIDDDNAIIKRMKPSWADDDGNDLTPNQGLPGDGVPYEPLLRDPTRVNTTISGEQLRLEDNKLLVAFNRQALINFINNNYPPVENLNRRIIEPKLALESELRAEVAGQQPSNLFPNAQLSDINFRVVDVQDDILSHTPEDKHVTLTDPAGNYMDSFRYRTTFNNLIVTNVNSRNPVAASVIVTPGYRGMESFERTDPTYFKDDLRTVIAQQGSGTTPPTYDVIGDRYVPSSIVLDAKDAMIASIRMDDDGRLIRTGYGGYSTDDRNNPNLTRFKDPANALFNGFNDSHWNGWDFIGDHYQYPKDYQGSAQVEAWTNSTAMAREAALPTELPLSETHKTRFYQMLGGFENYANVNTAGGLDQARRNFTGFTWRVGVRELIRAGYDPHVDDQLTVRVLGRKFVDFDGMQMQVDMPVGEVMIYPAYRIVNPGEAPLQNALPQTEAEIRNLYNIGGFKQPVFAKLRNGDTAFTIDLRREFNSLTDDLRNASGDEPMIEIMVVMRKTTRDINPLNIGSLMQQRPDLALLPGAVAYNPQNGFFMFNGSPVSIGGLGDDNYFFKGIELVGRGRGTNNNDAKLQFLAGTPGRDNTGYVPAYPRRRYELAGRQRDQYDLIDNTAYLKNGPLATLGEVSRLFTGKKFETVNTPIIPQRLEDKAADTSQNLNNFNLARRSISSDPYRVQLAQRERLDQWENQYTQIYNMITTALDGIVPGLININTAQREVLAALPSTPLLGPGRLDTLDNRYFFNAIVADFIIEGRQPGGHDMFFGVHEVDDDHYIAALTSGLTTRADTLNDYKLASVGREKNTYKNFDDIVSRVFNPLNVEAYDIKGDTLNFKNANASTIVSLPDDGPYADIGTLLAELTHLKRRDRFSERLRRPIDRTGDGREDGAGDLRERLNEELGRNLTPEDMEAMMNRISNLMTVRSRAFSVITRGRVFDKDGNISAQRKLQTVYER